MTLFLLTASIQMLFPMSCLVSFFLHMLPKGLMVMSHFIRFRQRQLITIVQPTAHVLKRAPKSELWELDRGITVPYILWSCVMHYNRMAVLSTSLDDIPSISSFTIANIHVQSET